MGQNSLSEKNYMNLLVFCRSQLLLLIFCLKDLYLPYK